MFGAAWAHDYPLYTHADVELCYKPPGASQLAAAAVAPALTQRVSDLLRS